MPSTNNSQQEAAESTPTPPSSTTPLLLRAPTSPSTSTYDIMPAPTRSPLSRAQTTTSTPNTSAAVTANLSRPLLARATTVATAGLPPARIATPTTRPSLLKRLTSQLPTTLSLSSSPTYNPPRPTNWTDHAHRSALLETWDAIREAAALESAKGRTSVLRQLGAVEKSLVLEFPELGAGEVVLKREWTEYVLGVALRHPFCAEGRAGRWEVLSGVGRAGGWGPW